MRDLIDKLPTGLRFSTPVVVSAVAVGLSLYVVGIGVSALTKAIFSSSLTREEADPLRALAADSEAYFDKSRKRFDGRSMYVSPTAPVRKPKVSDVVKPIEPPAPPPGPPPPPASYTGPAPTSFLGEYVLFGETKIKIGETVNGITVMAIDAPFSAKLGYLRGEYTVSLWPRLDTKFLTGAVALARMSSITEAGATPASTTSGAGTSGAAGGVTTKVGVPGALGAPGAPGAPGAITGGTGAANGAFGGAATANGGSKPRGAGTKPPTAPEGAAPGTPNHNPTTGPGDQPGADQPSGAGPGEDPTQQPGYSPAMEPQNLPEPDATSTEGVEYADRSLLPPTLTDAGITSMTHAQARTALEAISATDSLNVDDHSQARLDHERAMLIQRLQQNP